MFFVVVVINQPAFLTHNRGWTMPWPSAFFLGLLTDEKRQINEQHHWAQGPLRDGIEPRKQVGFSSAFQRQSGHLD